MANEPSTLAITKPPDGASSEAIQTLAQLTDQALKGLATQAEINQALVNRILKLEADLKATCNALVTVAEPLKSHLANNSRETFLHPAAESRMWRSVREQLLALHRHTGLIGEPSPPVTNLPPASVPLKSCLCAQEHFETPWYGYWCSQFKVPALWHRKQWEWCFIAQGLYEQSALRPGSRGLGFGVGEEPLTDAFAFQGCSIVATDLDSSNPHSNAWAGTHQHAGTLAALNTREICHPEDFRRRVSYRPVDMNAIPLNLTGFDFVWSACSLDHLGTLEKSAQFIINSLSCLRPGGVAVHTTEFNLASNEHTISEGGTVLFRQQDIEKLAYWLKQNGHKIELDWTQGNGLVDNCLDVYPYDHKIHLRLELCRYVVTSIGLIIRKKA